MNATGARDPQMHQTKKGNQWFFEIKAHIGVDAGTGYVHLVTAAAANVHDLDEAANLVRAARWAPNGGRGGAGKGALRPIEARPAARRHPRAPTDPLISASLGFRPWNVRRR
jgi:IS5 family transposase